MDKSINRRNFISKSIKTTAGLSLGTILLNLSACSKNGRHLPNLVKDPNGICDLPKGFKYTIISREGETMSDGNLVPDYHDGMACFQAPTGELVLVRNHEIPLYFPTNAKSPVPEFAYDPDSSGGTTTVYLNDRLEVTKHYLSLTGTILNCSGGATPWNTWISCEETGSDGWIMGKRHGYNFEVDPFAPLSKPKPLIPMGRFRHEAVVVDPKNGTVYQTEDDVNGCFYRFLPNQLEQLEKGGILQALTFVDESIKHTSNNPLVLGKKYDCGWVTIDEPDPEENTLRNEAQDKGAAIFIRGEGIAAHEDGVYFACTSGGSQGLGQFFKYIPNEDNQGGTIELVYEATEKGVIEKPDQITLNQWGDLIICEDNNLDTQCLIGLTPAGKIYYIASNTQSEWSGACFSPDQKILFANIHKKPGMTVAIQGDWESLRSTT